MSSKRIINPKQREAVVRKLYRDALALDWLHLPDAKHSEQYRKWIEDPEVGKVLGKTFDAGEIRVWLKDVPMKEFARALAGEGDFAHCLDVHPYKVSNIVKAALGEGWSEIPDTVGIKPMHCVAQKGSEQRWLCWNRARYFKDLLWSALERWEKAPETSPLIVVHDSLAAPVSSSLKRKQERIAERAGMEVKFIRV